MVNDALDAIKVALTMIGRSLTRGCWSRRRSRGGWGSRRW